jgi:hypothetical protein
VVSCCAVLVLRLSFVSVLGHWSHIGPVLGTTLGCLWGPGDLPKGFQETTQRTQTESLGVICGAGRPPEGGREPPRDNPGDPKSPPAPEAPVFFENVQTLAKISFCRNEHAVEAINPFSRTKCAGRGKSRCWAENQQERQKRAFV